ncbi:MAG: hypothetical protein ACK49R_11535, partial [Planctomycetota bacterium]
MSSSTVRQAVAKMSAAETELDLSEGEPQESGYRAISKAAVASVVFASLGLWALWAAVFVVLQLLGLSLGLGA